MKNRNYIFITYLITFVSLCLSPHIYGADNFLDRELTWKNVQVNGRSTTVFSLHLDSKGVMWIGTNNGLFLYDGIINHLVNSDKLVGAKVYTMTEYENKLFLGTSNGLFSFDYRTGNVDVQYKGTPKEIRCMQMIDNKLWIGSLYGVFILDPKSESVVNVSNGLPHKSVYSMLRDSRGILYVGTFDGLAKWDSIKKRFVQVKGASNTVNAQNLFVNCLLESNDGEYLYVGSEGALYRYYIASDKCETVPNLDGKNIKSIARMNGDDILVGTDDGVFEISNGMIRHYQHDSRQSNTLSDNEIWCIYTDNRNNVWVGHDRGFSISYYSNYIQTLRLSSLTNSGDGNEIHVALRDKGNNLWLGGTNGILQLTNNGDTRWYRHYNSSNSLSHNHIRAIFEDAEGNVWLSTDGGLNRFNNKIGRFDVFNIVDENGEHNTNWVYAMDEDSTSYWIGGFLGGLHRVAKSKFNMAGGVIHSDLALNADNKDVNSRLANDFVSDIVKDRNGDIWILLFGSDILSCYNPKTSKLKDYNIMSMCGNYPSKIAKDSINRVWCAFSGGVIVFDNESKYKVVRFASSDESESIVSMGAVGKDMWISTHSNVWKVDGKTLHSMLLPIPQKAYTAVYEDKVTHKVILGGIDEIVEIDPSKLTRQPGLHGIRMILLNSDNHNINFYPYQNSEESLTIPYGGSVSLVVSSLNYSPESVHRYMYKLVESGEEDSEGWTVLPEGVNTISFTDLKMGSFDILAKRAGMPDVPIIIPLTVRAPLALSWWAICIYILFVFGIIYGIVFYMHKRNQRKYQEEERKKSLENVEKKLTFLSNISHDLKVPLSMILGPASLMKEKEKDEADKKTLETIYDNAVRLNNMIHKTIELQHLEDSEDNLFIQSTFNVVEFCSGIFETFKENNPKNKFIFHTSCNEIMIDGDAVKFESVITNLLSNACKYSEEGATISCGISKISDKVEIVVSDDGIGIEEVDQPLVFQRMFRAPSTAKLREGTGLGLYLIKKYLELMNGNIDLYSKKGQGTSFIVTLPITNREVVHKDVEVSDTDENRFKVLVVEDNAQISDFLTNILRQSYNVLTAENGRAGLSIASSFLPDLIILDEMMPIMSGLEMCKRMKQNPRLASIPVIMLTAKSDINTENESIKLGIDVFMSKPFEPAALLGRISHLLKTRKDIRDTVRIQTITEVKPIEAESSVEKQLAKIAKIIEDNVSDPDLNVNFLCEKSDIPQKQLYRIIKKYMCVAPLDYIRRVRLQKAAMLLSQHRFSISEISYMVGFKTPSYFAKCFQAQFGVKPSQYKSDDENIDKKTDI